MALRFPIKKETINLADKVLKQKSIKRIDLP